MPKTTKAAAAAAAAKAAAAAESRAAEERDLERQSVSSDGSSESSGEESEDHVELLEEHTEEDGASGGAAGEAGAPAGADVEDGAAGGGAAEGGAVAGGTALEGLPAVDPPHGPPKKVKGLSKMKAALNKFAAKYQEYAADTVTEYGEFLQNLTGQGQSKLGPLPDNARLLLDALQGKVELAELAALTPGFFADLQDLGFDTEGINTATAAVNMTIVTRNAVDKGRLFAHTKEQHAVRQSAGGSASGGGTAGGAASVSAGAQPPQGPATGIYAMYQNVDKDAHKNRSAHPPTETTPEGKEMLKQVLIATLNGNQAKVTELLDLFARTFGTQGVASHLLFSSRVSIANGVHEGAYQFGISESGGAAALTVQIAGATAHSKDGGLAPLPSKFDRREHFAAEDKLMDEIKAGTASLKGSKRDGSSINVVLTGHSHRNQQARALLQELAAYTFIAVAESVKFPDHLMYSEVKELSRIYSIALRSPTEDEALKLASASEFNSPLSPEALVLAKASTPYTNIASNFLAEYTRIVNDTYQTRYLGRISQLAQERPKRGESAQDFYGRLDTKRMELRQLPLPRINFEEIGYTIDRASGIPKIIHSTNLIVMMLVDLMFVELPKAIADTRVREVIDEAVFEAARDGRFSSASLTAAFSKLNDLRINTVPTLKGDEDKQQQRQVGAFAAAKTGDKGGGKPQQPSAAKPPERGRPAERHAASDGSASKRSQSQGTSSVAFYKKSIDYVVKHGALKYLQGLHDKCKVFGEAIFEVDQTGSIVVPLKLVGAHSWGQYGGKFGQGSTADSALWAGLMLARDICSRSSTLSRTGSQHCSDNDTAWTKEAAIDLRGDLVIAGVNDLPKRVGKGKKRPVVAAAAPTAAAPQSFGNMIDEGLGQDNE